MWNLDPMSELPIWRQVEAAVLHQIATGALRPGEAAPSVRELARLLQVNPLTIQRAYRRLIELGVLVTQRGEGTYVSSSPPRPSSTEREKSLAAAASRFVLQAHTLGSDLDDALAAVRAAWQSSDADPPTSDPGSDEER